MRDSRRDGIPKTIGISAMASAVNELPLSNSDLSRMNAMDLLAPPCIDGEEWRTVTGYENRYDVSNMGRVWSRITNRILSGGPTSKGYLTVSLYDGSTPKKPKSLCIHEIVAIAFIGRRPEKYTIDHVDGNKRNNAVGNLEYVTQSENSRRAHANGLTRTYEGSEHANSRLTDDDVRSIRVLWKHRRRGLCIELARQFNVGSVTVRNAAMGRTYKHVS
jgi:hypothetical protein